jgi:hypothetical protein
MMARSFRRKRGRFVLALVAVTAFGPRLHSAPHHEDQASGSPSLKKELEPLAYFGGRWTCTGVFPSTGKAIASDIVARAGLEGAWLVLRHDDAPPNRFHATELWGFEPNGRQFVAYIFDNFGGAKIHFSRLGGYPVDLERGAEQARPGDQRALRVHPRQRPSANHQLRGETRVSRLGHRRQAHLQKVAPGDHAQLLAARRDFVGKIHANPL